MEYALSIEEGVRIAGTSSRSGGSVGAPLTLRSEVGGFHSVKLTKDNFDKILRQAIREEVAE
jgi:hypothetical protein